MVFTPLSQPQARDPSRCPGPVDGRARHASYMAAVLADSPLGLWMLGEASGTVATDATGNGHNGTYLNTPTLGVAGQVGPALQLNGTNQSVEVTNVTGYPTTGAYTLEALAYFATAATNQHSIISQGHWDVGSSAALRTETALTSLTALRHFWSSNDQIVITPIEQNRWYHFAITYNGSVRRLYVNGVQVGPDNTPSAGRNTGANPLRIGFFNTQYLNGRVQGAAVYGSALSAAQILAHAQAAGLA